MTMLGMGFKYGGAPFTTPGAYIFISSQAASSSTSITFSGLSSSYAAYQIIVANLNMSVSPTSLNLTMNADGGANYTYTFYQFSDQPLQIVGSGSGATSVNVLSSINTGGWCHPLKLTIYNPSASDYCNTTWLCGYETSAGFWATNTGMSTYTSAVAITSVTLTATAGNITSGNFYLYGILNT